MVRTKPPQPLSFKATPTSVKEDIARLIEQSRKIQNQISTIDPETAIFANILLPLAHAKNALNLESHVLIFYKDVSPDPERCEASRNAKNILDNLKGETAMREDVFVLVTHDDVQQMNVSREYNRIRQRILPFAGPPDVEWGHGAAKLGSIMKDDYDACYYSYLL